MPLKPVFSYRGSAVRLLDCDEPEVILSGPSETGKTMAALQRCDNLARAYPGAQGAIIRKVQQDLWGTVVKAFRDNFERDGITHYGGEKPEWFDYPNGSRIWVGGLDRPGAFLSGQLDFVYVNQAEETHLADWETLTTRTTGRAGNLPFGQVFGDCNPGPPMHWIKQRPSIRLLESRHENNPMLYDAEGQLTEQGIKTMATLEKLTGARAQRLGKGLWVSAEGTVYEFDPARHVAGDDELNAWGVLR